MPIFYPMQEVYVLNDNEVEGIVQYSLLIGSTIYYCICTNDGKKRFFSEDEIVPVQNGNNPKTYPNTKKVESANWMACSFIEYLFSQISENKCYLNLVSGLDDDYWWLHLQEQDELEVKMDIRCSFCDNQLLFHEIRVDWELQTEPFEYTEGELSIDLEESDTQEDYKLIIINSLTRFLEKFPEFEGINELISLYQQDEIIPILVEKTEDNELIWNYEDSEDSLDGTAGYESSDDVFSYRYIYEDEDNESYLKVVYQGNLIAIIDDDLLLYNSIYATEESSADDEAKIDTKDIIVLTGYYNRCIYQEHDTEIVNAAVHMVDFNKQMTWEETVKVFYCRSCNCYYMFISDFEGLKKKGYLGCKVVTIQEYTKGLKNGARWKEQSVLKQYGYSVSKQDGLSKDERQNILSFILENTILTIPRTCDYLNWFIVMAKDNPNKKEAIEKWEEDIEFVKKYKIGCRKVKVGTIYKKQRVVED